MIADDEATRCASTQLADEFECASCSPGTADLCTQSAGIPALGVVVSRLSC